jgi:ribosome modulation factor
MSNSSKLRRDGRRAYCPGNDPDDICPYKADGHKRRTWLAGWYDEEDFHDSCKRDEEESRRTNALNALIDERLERDP